jgi:putative sterol carrier protein
MRRVTAAGFDQGERLLNGELRRDTGSREGDRRAHRALFRYLGEHELLGVAIGDDVSPALTLLTELAGSGAVRQGMAVRTQLLTARYLSRYGTDRLEQQFLGPLLTGTRVASLALAEDGAAPAEAVSGEGGGSLLVSGRLPLAAGAAECDFVMLAVATCIGLSLAVVDVDTHGIQLLSGTPGAGRSSFEIQLDRVAIAADQILGSEGQGAEYLQVELPVALLTSTAIIVSIAEHAWQRLSPQTGAGLSSDLAKAWKALFSAASHHKYERSFLKASNKAERLARTVLKRLIEESLSRSSLPALIYTICSALDLPEHTFCIPRTDSSDSTTDRTSARDREPMTAADEPTPATVAELISSLPARLRAERSADWTATFHFCLKGDRHPEWTVNVDDGRCQVCEGLHGSPDCVVRMKAETYIGIESGTVNPQVAFMTGRAKVSDLAQMMRYIKSFRPVNRPAGQKP